MKKIMFNDKYGLTQAVLEGIKTNTRRIIPLSHKMDFYDFGIDEKRKIYATLIDAEGREEDVHIKYQFGEEVAIAQSYESMTNEGGAILASMMQDEATFKPEYCGVGWHNKMFVCADLMPHRIKITNISVERLQDISDEDCLKEGIIKMYDDCNHRYVYGCITGNKKVKITPSAKVEVGYDTPQEAFAYLIDKTCGKGTWDSNPWVFVYDFKLIK